MLELVFFIPFFVVVAGALVTNCIFIRRPFNPASCAIIGSLSISALILPLAVGVWIPDFIGNTRTLASTTTPTGYSFHVTQYWNHYDFYTTTLYITAPSGGVTDAYLDGDDQKNWSVPLAINEFDRTATVILSGGRIKIVQW